LLSLGEDILELAGDELLEGLVAAAIIRGDVVVVDVKDRLEGYFGPSTTLSSTLNQGRVARRGELLDSWAASRADDLSKTKSGVARLKAGADIARAAKE
jgi:hypothetical protein